MRDEAFRIYVDQLRNGGEEEISESLSPDFLDIHEKELHFSKPVNIKGEAYTTQDSLVIHLDISTVATLPCSICNENADFKIEIHDFYHSELLDDIKSGVYDFREMLREAILLEVPPFIECNGKCPTRENVKQYFKKAKDKELDEVEGYQPFADLKLDDINKKKKTKS